MNLTKKEQEVYNLIKDVMDDYGDGFSDVTIEDIVLKTGLSPESAEGVVGSLIKKEIVGTLDVNGDYNIYYLIDYLQ